MKNSRSTKHQPNLRQVSGTIALSLGILFPAALSVPAHADFTLVMRNVTNGAGISNTTNAELLLSQASSPGGGWEFVDFTQDPNPATIDVAGGGSFNPTATLPNGNASDDRYALTATANLVIPAGTWTIGFGSDDGGSIRIPGITFSDRFNNSGSPDADEVRWETGRGHTWTGGTFTVASDLITTIEAIQYENTGGDSWEIAFAPGTEGGFNANWDLLEDGVNGWTVQVAPIDDTDPPLVDTLAPGDDSADAFGGGNLVATFNEDIALTGLGTITVTDTTDGSSSFTIDLTSLPDADGDVSITGGTLTIDPAVDLEFLTDYEVTISADAIEDTWSTPNAFAGLASGDWNFTTAEEDTTAPIVQSFDPLDEATLVSPAADLSVTFDDDIVLNSGATQTILSQDFSGGDGGFTVLHTDGTTWAFGPPDSSGLGGEVTAGNTGSDAWGTGLGDFNGPFTDNGYFDNPTTTALRSSVIDLTGIASAELSFAQALDLDAGDTAVVNIIDDTTDGVISAAIYTADDSLNVTTANWEDATGIAIPAAALGQAVRIEWVLTGFGGTNADYMGWYIDDVVVTGVSSDDLVTLTDLTNGGDILIPSDSPELSVSGNVLTINPENTLAGGANIAVQIGSGVVLNLGGLPFAGISDPEIWDFTTSAVTTITGTTPGTGSDTWNNPANWDAGVPTGVLQAIIADGVATTVDDGATPTYSGGLIIGAGSSIDISGTAGSENAVGTGPITFQSGSTLTLRTGVDNVTIPGDIEFAGDALITNQSNSTDNEQRFLTGNITGTGLFTYELRRGNILHLDGTNTWSGGFVCTNIDNNVNNTSRVQPGDSGLGTGDVTINDQVRLEILSGLTDTIDDSATLNLNGVGLSNGIKLEIDSDETVGFAFRDGSPLQPGTWGAVGNGSTTFEADWIGGSGVLTVSGIATDSTAPTITEFGAPAAATTIFGLPTIPFTVTFDEEVDPATVDLGDFSNAGTAPVSIGSVTLLSSSPFPSVYEVEVVPSGAGTVQLSVSGTIDDYAGNSLVGPVDDTTVFTLDTTPQPAKETITIVDYDEGSGVGGGGLKTLAVSYDASGGDKLVVVLGGEHGFGGNTGGQFNSVTLNGVSLTEVVQEEAGIPTAAIFYLDDPGSAGVGDIVVDQGNHNGSIFGIYLLSGTDPGIGAAGKSTTNSVGMITAAPGAMVIAGVLDSGPSGGNGGSNASTDAPLVEDTLSDLESGSRWVSMSYGSAIIASPEYNSFSFSGNGSANLLATVAVEIPAANAAVSGSPFGTWASSFPGLTDTNPEVDFDGGSLATGLEWVLGGDPTSAADDLGLVPTFDDASDPDFFIFTYRLADAAAADGNTSVVVEYGSDLTTDWTEALAGADVQITPSDDAAGPGVDLIEVKLRRTLATGGKLFARVTADVQVPVAP